MYPQAIVLVAAGIWTMALSAQTPPARFPGVPQFVVTPPLTVTPQVPRAPQLLKRLSPQEKRVCSIPLLVVPVAKNVEQMPVVRPRADYIGGMPVIMPAPPCEGDQR
jgi:hypothetical protein